MKKMLALLSVILMFVLCFGAVAEEAVGMPNPMVETDAEGLAAAIGVELNVPEGAENVQYFVIAGDLGELRFTLDGTEICARVQCTAEATDISGLYYEFELEEPCNVSGVEGVSYRTHDGDLTVDLCEFYDVAPGIMYSVSAIAKDLDGFDIIAIAEQVYLPMQGEVG